MKPANAYLRQEMRSYLAAVPDATEQELAALNVWVRQGNSPYCNPSHIADEQGREMPFIHAMRAEMEFIAEAEASETSTKTNHMAV